MRGRGLALDDVAHVATIWLKRSSAPHRPGQGALVDAARLFTNRAVQSAFDPNPMGDRSAIAAIVSNEPNALSKAATLARFKVSAGGDAPDIDLRSFAVMARVIVHSPGTGSISG